MDSKEKLVLNPGFTGCAISPLPMWEKAHYGREAGAAVAANQCGRALNSVACERGPIFQNRGIERALKMMWR
jgi:hypothetical protein